MAEEPRLLFSFEEFHNSACGWPRPNFPIDVKQNATAQGCEFKLSCHGAWSVCNCEEAFFSTRDKTDNAFTIHVLYVHNTSRRVAFRPNPCGINCCLVRMLSYRPRSYCDVQIPQTNECRSCQPVVAKSRFPQFFLQRQKSRYPRPHQNMPKVESEGNKVQWRRMPGAKAYKGKYSRRAKAQTEKEQPQDLYKCEIERVQGAKMAILSQAGREWKAFKPGKQKQGNQTSQTRTPRNDANTTKVSRTREWNSKKQRSTPHVCFMMCFLPIPRLVFRCGTSIKLFRVQLEKKR